MFYDFQTTTHGKWILAGEHAVLRGHAALVFPVRSKTLTLSYKYSEHELNANYDGSSGADMHLLFWSVLEQGQQLLGKSLKDLSGHFHLQSDIPIGVGMGASAALCVAVAYWFNAQQSLGSESVYSFAKNLENLFHGQSSGLDIAGVSSETGLHFQQGKIQPIKQTWHPHWFLSSCGQIGITAHCINQVQTLWQANAASAASIDAKMNEGVQQARMALENNQPQSLYHLTSALQQTADCFKQWGLVSDSLQQHMQKLLDFGALAVKPTGSGSGGYVVSLWDKPPPVLPIELIAV